MRTKPISILEGKGHYIGNILWVARPDGGSFSILEGDDIIIVDGQTLAGTGMEDAYNCGYYYNWVGIQSDEPEGSRPTSAIRAYYGLLNMDAEYDPRKIFYRSDQYRWHIPDYIPFNDNINVLIENYGHSGNISFGSTAFYYLIPEPSTILLLLIGLMLRFKNRGTKSN